MHTKLSSEFPSVHASTVADIDSGARTIKLLGHDWEKYRPLIYQLYVDEDKSLEQVMDYMHKQFGFSAK